ncbi:MAG: flippase-like domain-containing protein [Saprospiraceae bacterium]|nr:flippase-like domain-containing protein [Saprospiraceae bacterium]
MSNLLRFTIPTQRIMLLISMCLTGFIAWQIHAHVSSVAVFGFSFLENNHTGLWVILLFTATIVNWWIEMFKWHLLVSKTTQTTFGKSARAVLGGLVIGLITPGRLGEIPGRMLFYSDEFRLFLLSNSLFASLAQNLWNVLVGGMAMCSLFYFFDGTLLPEVTSWFSVSMAFLALVTAVLAIFYKVLLKKMPFIANRLRSVEENLRLSVQGISHTVRVGVLVLSGARYVVYLGQYMVIIFLLVPEIQWLHVATVCSLQFMLQTIIPVPAVLSLPARAQLAILCWNLVDINPGTAFIATSVLWVLNLGIPGLLGAITLLLRKKSHHENTFRINTIFIPQLSSENGTSTK